MEMSSDERKAQPWIFFSVDGDEDVRGFGFLVFCSEGRLKRKGQRQKKRDKKGIKKLLFNTLSAFFIIKNTYTKHIFYIF